ncbi:MAG: hypothetical protein M0005_13250 [Actinomycetota bacterium]|nr:hypothetical protein [Actinomycetota bacterium]
MVLAALRQGIVVDPDRGPFGGLPERLRPDNGLEFAAKAIERSCAALGIECSEKSPSRLGWVLRGQGGGVADKRRVTSGL